MYHYYYWDGSGIPSLMLFIDWQLCESWLVPVYTIQQSAIANFNLPLLYIIFYKNQWDYCVLLLTYTMRSISEESRWGHRQNVRGVCNNYSDPRSIWKFYISPWMQCITTLLLSSRIGLTVQRIDITQSILAWQTWQDSCSLARSRLAWKKYSSKVPASVRGQIN